MKPVPDDFRNKARDDLVEALQDYDFECDTVSLDSIGGNIGRFEAVPVSFGMKDPSARKTIIMYRDDTSPKRVMYLPWHSGRYSSISGISTAYLDANTPEEYFFTSSLSGCRISIMYHDDMGKRCTVMHLAGDITPSGGRTKKFEERDMMQEQVRQDAMQQGRGVRHTRSFSIGCGEAGKLGGTFKKLKADRPDTIYYEGGGGAFMGRRLKSGRWVFWCQDIRSGDDKNVVQQIRR